MSFWVCFYHIVWTTKHRTPLLTADIERVVFQRIKQKSITLNCPLLAINGTSDHIHVAVKVTPRLAVAEWVRQAKGVSTRTVNEHFPDLPERFQWQQGYGVLTFGTKQLPFVLRYIEQQKQHHHENSVYAYLERCDND